MKCTLCNVDQLEEAAIEFGDLTTLVGPESAGKSIFLQYLKLMVDGPNIIADLRRYDYD